MKYLEDSRLTQLTTDLTGATLNTRGSGTGPTPIGLVRSTNTKNNSKGKGSKNKQQSGSNNKSTSSNKRSSNNKKDSGASTPNYYAYNPVGYSSYNNNGKTTSTPSSCRVIYGRVEAYTTKRAGSDKQLAFEVGERYAHEMERLNEAVEALKRRHAEQHQLRVKEMGEENNDDDAGNDSGGIVRSKKSERRARSRSLDGVTFDTTASSSLVYDKSTNTSEMMESNESTAPLSPLDEDKETITSHAKRTLPLEGILKEPTSNKRCRATSFDISTGPSAISSRPYHCNESSSSLLPESTWGSSSSNSRIHHPNDEDYNTRPIIPQPSLYQSSLEGDGDKKKTGPTMVPRRLMTDLILTLNASFPDYDFGDAQTSDFCTLSTDEAMRRVNEKLGEFAATTDEGRDFLPRFWNALDDVLFHGLKDCEVYSYSPASGGDDPLEFLTTSMANETQVSNDGSVQMAVANQEQPAVMFSPSGGGRIISGERLSSDGIDMSMLDVPRQISPAMDSSPHVTLWSMNYFFVSKNKKRIVLVACVETMRTPQGDANEDGSDGYDDEYENNLVFDEARREKAAKAEEEEYPLSVGVDFSSPSDVGSVGAMVEETEDEHEIIDVDEDVCEDQDFDTGTMSAPTQMD